MATNFPTSIDAFTDPNPGDPQNSPGALNHATQHTHINDGMAAVQAYVGVTGSGVAGTVTKKLNDVITAEAADAANIATNSGNITNLLASNPAGAAQGQVYIAATATAGTAINNAIASFGSTKGVVQLGKGTFTLDTAVVLADNVTIRGMGRSSTFLVFNPASFSPAMSAGTTPINRATLQDFRIQSSTDGSGVALDLGYVNYGVVTRVDIGASGAYPNKGIDFSINNATSRPYYNVIRDCYIATGGASPIGIDISNQANSNVVDNVRCDMPGSSSGTPIGVKVGGASQASHSILIMHLDVESVAAATGVLITNSSYNVTLIDCYFEAINKCIQIDAGCTNVRGIGTYMYNWGANHVLDNSGADINISGLATVVAGAGASSPFAYRSGIAPFIFTANGTLTAANTYGASAIKIRGVNGGASSGGCATTGAAQSAHSGPGAGGAYAEKTISTVGLTYPLQVNIGAAGAAPAAGANNGNLGGQSSVKDNNGAGATLWTPGVQTANQKGLSGAASATVGDAAVPGFEGFTTASTADFVVPGQGANVPTRVAAAVCARAYGGNSVLGAGGLPGNGTAGTAGTGYGSGGGGSYLGASTTQVAGAAGAPGIVIVELIFS